MTAPETSGVSALRCPHCGAPIQVRARGISVRIVCGSCRRLYDTRDSNFKLIEQYAKVQPRQPMLLEIGARGELRGDTFEIIGMLERTEDNYAWQEYLLFNPSRGLRWLIWQEGHWSLGNAVHDSALESSSRARVGGSLIYKGKTYNCYHRGRSTVTFVLGEFPWRVKVGDKSDNLDYIRPPRMLSRESMKTERRWTLIEHLPAEEVGAAFKITVEQSVALVPHMLNPVGPVMRRFAKAAGFLVALLVVGHVFATLGVQRTTLTSQSIQLGEAYAGHTIALGPFEMKGRPATVKISSAGQVVNQWLDLDFSLVNEVTQEHFDVHQGIERYSGYDSDGPWSEGDNSASSVIGAVPAGRYTLLVDASSGDASYARFDALLNVTVERGVAVHGAFVLVLLLLLGVPAWIYRGYHGFEKERWDDSEFNPYNET